MASRKHTDVSDAELVAAIASSNDQQALAQLYDRHGSLAYSLALRVVRDSVLAEEAVQDAFLAIWRGAERFDHRAGSVAGWLMSIVRRRAIDRVRREEIRRRAVRALIETAPAGSEGEAAPAESAWRGGDLAGSNDPFSATWSRFQSDRVRGLVEQLPAHQRTLIELAYFGGLSQSEIAETTELPLGTVKTRTLRGLARLRDLAIEEGLVHDDQQ
ncbi:MAG: sigma-70 family RNA polymerase sigma factor [Thermoleophilia bacterium]|nr:sigma-70 family RNA polymerase sigma factor [Thermoleophilia bacterium]